MKGGWEVGAHDNRALDSAVEIETVSDKVE